MRYFDKDIKKINIVGVCASIVVLLFMCVLEISYLFDDFALITCNQIIVIGFLIAHAICYLLGKRFFGLDVAILIFGIDDILSTIVLGINYLIYLQGLFDGARLWVFGYIPQLIAGIVYVLMYVFKRKKSAHSSIVKAMNILTIVLDSFLSFFTTLIVFGYFQVSILALPIPLSIFYFVLLEGYERKKNTPMIFQAMFCRKCGADLEKGSRFCRKCGTEIIEEKDL